MKIFTQSVFIFCRNRERLLLNIFFYIEGLRNFQVDSAMIMFDAAPAWVLFEQFLICFLSLFWCPASNNAGSSTWAKAIIFNMFFIVILTPSIQRITLSIKDVMENLHIAGTVKENVQPIFFYIEANVWLLLQTIQCFLMNVQLLLKKIFKKTEIYLKEKMCFLELCPLKKYFEVKTD